MVQATICIILTTSKSYFTTKQATRLFFTKFARHFGYRVDNVVAVAAAAANTGIMDGGEYGSQEADKLVILFPAIYRKRLSSTIRERQKCDKLQPMVPHFRLSSSHKPYRVAGFFVAVATVPSSTSSLS